MIFENRRQNEQLYQTMTAKLTVFVFIILGLQVGILLMLMSWLNLPMIGDWSENYFLVFLAQKTGFTSLPQIIGSGWVRGAVTGIGILNLGIAFWEMAHFNQTVKLLSGDSENAENTERKENAV